MFDWLLSPESYIVLLTLTSLEIVLGIDNIIFISILVGKLPDKDQARARLLGLCLAMLMRIALLLSISGVMKLIHPLFEIFHVPISGKDLILIIGGLFLLAKSTHEIHAKLEGDEDHLEAQKKASFVSVIIQIMLLDIVFSLDSVITAVGMSNQIPIMVLAVVMAVIFMLFFSGSVSRFVHQHPTIKMLALSFLLLIGVTLMIEGFHQHIPKGYIYFAMAFSVAVEMLNLRISRKKKAPLELREPTL